LLRIGTQARPDIFAVNIEDPKLLYDVVVEVEERVTRTNCEHENPRTPSNSAVFSVVQSPNMDLLKQNLLQLKSIGITSLAVCLLHSYGFPDHELAIEDLATQMGFRVSTSHKLTPMIKALPRASTAVLDAFLTPLLHE
jgi:5-oxoprolinase (ATP-hydrolysing)